MMMDIVVKIPQEVIKKANDEFERFQCLRKESNFKFVNGEWRVDFSCGRYGNGYGVGFSCKENCKLRITDLSKCKEVEYTSGYGKYLIQDEFYDND